MSEEQTPFITREGKLSPASALTASKLIAIGTLAGAIGELQREQLLRGRLYPGWIENKRLDRDKAVAQLRDLEHALLILSLLQEPRVNTALTAFLQLDPTMQALVSDIALELVEPSLGRQALANDLRKRVEGRS